MKLFFAVLAFLAAVGLAVFSLSSRADLQNPPAGVPIYEIWVTTQSVVDDGMGAAVTPQAGKPDVQRVQISGNLSACTAARAILMASLVNVSVPLGTSRFGHLGYHISDCYRVQ